MIRLGLVAALLAAASAKAETDHRRHRVTPKDFAAFEAGLALTEKLQPELFPNGIAAVSAVVYDGLNLYVYSRNEKLPFKKVRRWNGYRVYRLRYEGEPLPHQWGGCRGGGGSFVETTLAGRLRGEYFECATLTTFVAVQKKKRGSIYTSRESYVATIAHEVGHQYHLRQGPHEGPPQLERLVEEVEKIVPGSSALGSRAIREAYATWVELKASETCCRSHQKNLLRPEPHKEQEHSIGLRAAQALYKGKASTF